MNDIFDYDFFENAIEDVGAYDDYDDAYEDVDMFDENYFEAMEGPARDYRHTQNAGKKRKQIRAEREDNWSSTYGPYTTDFNPKERLNQYVRKELRYANQRTNSKSNVGPNTIKRTRTDNDGNVYSVQAEQRNVMDIRRNGLKGPKTYA